jgi:uncharacterized protein (DUF1015 family)
MFTKSAPPLVVPFRAERFANLERLGRYIAPPYDVISAQLRGTLAEEERNIVHVILPDGDADRYERAAARYRAWLRDGTIVSDRKNAVYVVRQDFKTPTATYSRTGMVGALAVEPYDAGRVRPHEKTHSGPKEDRLRLLRATNAMFEALLMIAPDQDGTLAKTLMAATNGPRLARAQLDGVDISLWQLDGSRAERLAEIAGVGPVYIADGHHRYETAVAFRKEKPVADRTLALIVPRGDPGLVVLPTHRIISGEPVSEHQVQTAVADYYDVVRLDARADIRAVLDRLRIRGEGCVVALPGGKVFALTEKAGVTLPRFTPAQDTIVQRLDVARVDAIVVDVLKRATGRDAEVSYSAEADDVIARVESGASVGVFVPAPSLTDVLAVADGGGCMPQKSTYFYPKVPSGLVMMSWT